ncbi:MAG TPA: Coq4 family protein [Kofleriaceae bacterium]|nr:Coq4 family protein [Kofleriaceae bacterium]
MQTLASPSRRATTASDTATSDATNISDTHMTTPDATSSTVTKTSHAAPAREPVVDVADLPPRVRLVRAVKALAKIVADPEQTELVLEFSNLINAGHRDDRLHFFFDDPQGARLWEERRAIDSKTVDLDALAALPEGTLGHAYARFMKAHGLTPDVFDGPPNDVRDPQAAYVIQRIRQTHDLWHVVTGAETDPAGEVALQAFTFAQLRAPSSGILAAVGTLRGMRYTRQIVKDTLELYRLGTRANKLATFPWEDHWTTPLADVRRLLGLPEQSRGYGGYSAGLHKMAA